MRVLVVGGAGYVGSHLIHELLRRGDEAVVIDNLLTGRREILPQRVPFFQMDGGVVLGVHDILRKYAIDACVICSLLNGEARSREMPFHYYHNNFIAVFYLLQTLIKCGIKRVILSASLDIYGANISGVVDEDTTIHPTSPLGKTLAQCEDFLADLVHAEKLSCIIFRIGNIGGASPNRTVGHWPGSNNLIAALMDVAHGSKEYILASGDPALDILHIADVVEAHMIALRRLGNKAETETFILASGTQLRLSQIIAHTENITHREIHTKGGEMPFDLVPTMRANVERAVRELWQHAPLPIDRILHDAWEWRKKFPTTNVGNLKFSPNAHGNG
ncbi:MAG: NAD-dependent epimerase/dehydratase family protein [Puniceicoccales bacterium]|jgi:UDP-glucose 4-epimerase|nr:NAD-dependent epimerase/dehydratase family protein [Puniceicoccales bacterium]